MATSLWDASWALTSFSFPGLTFVVRTISLISLALGLFSSIPFILFIVYDILLWIWRIYWSRFAAKRHDAPVRVARDATAPTATTTAADAANPGAHTARRG